MTREENIKDHIEEMYDDHYINIKITCPDPVNRNAFATHVALECQKIGFKEACEIYDEAAEFVEKWTEVEEENEDTRGER